MTTTNRIQAGGRSRRLKLLSIAAQLLLLAAIRVRADDPNSAAVSDAELLAEYKVTGIRIIPSEVVFFALLASMPRPKE